MQLTHLTWNRTSKRYAYLLLSIGLACLLLSTSIAAGAAQEAQTPPAISPEITNSNPASVPSGDRLDAVQEQFTIERVPSIKSISPKEFYIRTPQSLLPEDWRGSTDDTGSEDVIRVVVTGANFPGQAANQIKIKIGNPPLATAIATEVTADQEAVFAAFDAEELRKLSRGKHPVSLEVGNKVAQIDLQAVDNDLEIRVLRPVSGLTTLVVFMLAAAITGSLLTLIYRWAKRANLLNMPSSHNAHHLTTLAWLVLDRETNTLSLARTQFVWWLTIIVFGYLFLFVGRGLVQGVWEFVSLSGFAYTFLISLGTLVTAQATAELRGSKGCGEVNPAWSDLIVHGGVVALERVQQVIWNVIIGIAFVFILITTYTTASSLPNIPPELLALMGISAAGYISGKAIRKPGPKISQVTLCEAKPYLTITGEHFSQGSQNSGVSVQLTYFDSGNSKDEIANQIEVKKDKVATLELDDSKEFCKRLEVNLADLENLPVDWLEKFLYYFPVHEMEDSKEVKITIVNADGQRAVWDGSIVAPERTTSTVN